MEPEKPTVTPGRRPVEGDHRAVAMNAACGPVCGPARENKVVASHVDAVELAATATHVWLERYVGGQWKRVETLYGGCGR